MPIHSDYRDFYNSCIQQYGSKKGQAVFYATCKKRGWDYSKPRSKEFEPEQTVIAEIVKLSEDSPIFDEVEDELSDVIEHIPELDVLELIDLADDYKLEVTLKSTFGTSDWPDSAFMWVPPEARGADGKKSLRKLPYKNRDGSISLSHVRNALARLNQAQGIPSEAKARIRSRLQNILKRAGGYKGSELEEKSFQLPDGVELVSPSLRKEFYGAVMPIVNIEVKAVEGEENYYVEGFISTPLKDLQGETVALNVLEDWSRECVSAPHNLGWLWHESPYAAKENKDKAAFVKFVEANIRDRETGKNKIKGLWVRGLLNKNHPDFPKIWPQIRDGFINAFSAEFIPENIDPISKVLSKAKYLSTCLVMAPANEGATITGAYAKNFTGIELSTKQSGKEPQTIEELLNLRRLQELGNPNPTPPTPTTPTPATATPTPTPTPNPPTTPPVSPSPTPPTSTNDIENLRNQINALNAKIEQMNQVSNPTDAEIERVLTYLGKNKPWTVKTKDIFKQFESEEDYEDFKLRLIAEAKREGKLGEVVRKGVNENATDSTGTEADLSEAVGSNEHSIEGMLKRMSWLR